MDAQNQPQWQSSLAWPHARASHAAIAAQSGADRADLLHWALTTGDPLADRRVSRMIEGERHLQQALDQGLRQGLCSLTDPDPDLAALLGDLEGAAGQIDPDLLEHGSRPFLSMPGAVHIISLSVGSLIRVYESPSIAAVLAGTARLLEGADARLRETAKWLGEAMLPGALRPGAQGYLATVGVRLLHAKVRHYATKGDYDAAAYGVPINQVDLGRTWMDFTLTSWQAEASLGFDLTKEEIARAYQLWWYIGHLLGIDRRLIEGIETHADARRMDALFQAVTSPVGSQSAALARATIDSIATQLKENISLPTVIGTRLLRNLTGRFHGSAFARDLGVPPESWATAPVELAVAIIGRRRARLRRDPDAWDAMITRNLDNLYKSTAELSDDPEYASMHVGG